MATSHSKASVRFSRAISSSTTNAVWNVASVASRLETTYFRAKKLGKARGWS
ncbi:MAG TPA: hypothetical protein VGX78_20775 [Pirellulales bacterium]|nr:hypothetical protein [Pirellulales bacterium]